MAGANPQREILQMEEQELLRKGGTHADYTKVMGRRLAQASESLNQSDYTLFDSKQRKELIIQYVDLIEEMGFKPIRVFGQESLRDQGVSFRAIFTFKRQITGGLNIVRKHSAFFEARDWSPFSLASFNRECLETTDMNKFEEFKKALKIRIWNTGFTDEEILCAILPSNMKYTIDDLIDENRRLVIPNECINDLFYSLNVKGGAGTSSRIINRFRENDHGGQTFLRR